MADAGVIVTQAQIIKFSDEYKLQAQQTEARVAGKVVQKTFKGASMYDTYTNKISDSDVIKNRAVGAQTDIKDTSFATRRLIADTYTYPTVLAEIKVAEMLKNPLSEVRASMISAMNRKRDAAVLAAMIGNADVMQPDGSFVATPFAGTTIADGGTQLTVEKLRAAKVAMDKAEQPKEGRYIVAGAEVLDSLLAETSVTSSDYNVVKTLVNGELNRFLGFEFITTEVGSSLLVPFEDAIAFSGTGVLYGSNLEQKIDIEKNPGLYMDWSIQIEEQFGALRRDEDAVVIIEVA